MARKKAEPKAEPKEVKKAEPKEVKNAEPTVEPGKTEKAITELIEELHGRFTAAHGTSYRARQCSRITNKLKRLVAADDVLKG